jgi:predicted nucleic acid-binding protein
MSDRTFIDTNVLVYADDFADPAKRDQARQLIRQLVHERRGVLSMQVLQEYFAASTRKLRMSALDARERVAIYAQFEVVKLEPSDLFHAIDLHRRHRISIWDSLIVRAAILAGCQTIASEDLQDGFQIDNVRLVNPFTR